MATVTSGPSQARSKELRQFSRQARLTLYFFLHFAGFLVTTLLTTWGLFFFFFVAIGGFSFDGMMHQLNNLASRYVAADAARISSFKDTIVVAHVLVSSAVIVLRRHHILPAHPTEGTPHHG